jgi:hypothetical protein
MMNVIFQMVNGLHGQHGPVVLLLAEEVPKPAFEIAPIRYHQVVVNFVMGHIPNMKYAMTIPVLMVRLIITNL